MRDLFVCDAGQVRSPTAVRIARELAREKKIEDYDANSCGMVVMDTYPIDPEVFKKYDRIFVMMRDLGDEIIRRYGILEEKIINLDIPDVHSISEEKFRELLEGELREKLEPYFSDLVR
jgi:predicted protein tyrosine phosphatase